MHEDDSNPDSFKALQDRRDARMALQLLGMFLTFGPTFLIYFEGFDAPTAIAIAVGAALLLGPGLLMRDEAQRCVPNGIKVLQERRDVVSAVLILALFGLFGYFVFSCQ